MKKIYIFILFNLFFLISLSSQEMTKSKVSAEDILKMNESEAFRVIEKLRKEEASELITQIRSVVRKDYKEIDKFYLLISHLETIKAIEEEQARLRSLNLVYGLGLFLVIGLLLYVLVSQRKTIQNLNQLLKE